MSRRQIVHNRSSATLEVSFPYRSDLVDMMRSMRGRFSWERKVWVFPAHVEAALVQALHPLGFEGPEEGVSPSAASPDRGGAAEEAPFRWGVAALWQSVERALRVALPGKLYVVGELEEVRPGRGEHRYARLVERDSEGAVVASIRIVLFARAARRVDERLASLGAAWEQGRVLCLVGSLAPYAARGEVQLVVEDVDEDFLLGEALRRKEQVLQALQEMGLATRNLARPWPDLPLRVALVTAPESDACHDFLETLRRSSYPFVVSLFAVRVQGKHCAADVCAALDRIAAHAGHFDVCVLTRGGGGKLDLAAWDDLDIALRVANHPAKVLVAIGHELDRGVLDEIAHREKTPTAAASSLVALVDRAAQRLHDVHARLLQATSRGLREARSEALGHRQRLERACVRFQARSARTGPRAIEGRVRRAVGQALARASRRRARALQSLLVQSRRLLRLAAWERWRQGKRRIRRLVTQEHARASHLHAERARGLTQRIRGLMRRHEEGVEALERALRLADPARWLQLGYVRVQGASGAVLTRREQARTQDRLTLHFADGALAVRVDKEE